MLSLQTHELEKVPNTSGTWRISRVNPYVRLGSKSGVFFIQGGKVFAETGEEVSDPPGWVLEEAERLTPKVKAEVGWVGREKAPEQPADSSKQTLSLKK